MCIKFCLPRFSLAQGANEVGVGDGAIEAGQADDVLAGHRHWLHQDREADGAHHLVHTDSQMHIFTFTRIAGSSR